MEIYEESDYKVIIRKRVKELARLRRGLTLQKLASKLPVQNTYLSKALRDEKTHLNEDHLFAACRILKFFPAEIDFIFLLRARAIATGKERKSYLDSKIHQFRVARPRNAEMQSFDGRQLQDELLYLFDPLASLFHVSLFITKYRENPLKLCGLLGISQERVREILECLGRLGFIRAGEEEFSVKEVLLNQIHYGTDHPLMRAHQTQLRNMVSVHLPKVPEDRKQCFMGTFSADEATFQQIQVRFSKFLKEIEPLIAAATSEKVFQINFDTFQWF